MADPIIHISKTDSLLSTIDEFAGLKSINDGLRFSSASSFDRSSYADENEDIYGFEKHIGSLITRALEKNEIATQLNDVKTLQQKLTVTSAVLVELARRIDKSKRAVIESEEKCNKVLSEMKRISETNDVLVEENVRLQIENEKLKHQIKDFEINGIQLQKTSLQQPEDDNEERIRLRRMIRNPYLKFLHNKAPRASVRSAGRIQSAKNRRVKRVSRASNHAIGLSSYVRLVPRVSKGGALIQGASVNSSRKMFTAQESQTALHQIMSLLQEQASLIVQPGQPVTILQNALTELIGVFDITLQRLRQEQVNADRWKMRWYRLRKRKTASPLTFFEETENVNPFISPKPRLRTASEPVSAIPPQFVKEAVVPLLKQIRAAESPRVDKMKVIIEKVIDAAHPKTALLQAPEDKVLVDRIKRTEPKLLRAAWDGKQRMLSGSDGQQRKSEAKSTVVPVVKLLRPFDLDARKGSKSKSAFR